MTILKDSAEDIIVKAMEDIKKPLDPKQHENVAWCNRLMGLCLKYPEVAKELREHEEFTESVWWNFFQFSKSCRWKIIDFYEYIKEICQPVNEAKSQ